MLLDLLVDVGGSFVVGFIGAMSVVALVVGFIGGMSLFRLLLDLLGNAGVSAVGTILLQSPGWNEGKARNETLGK